jgi:hypothetical protein
MYILYDFVCCDLLHILLSCDKIMDPWNVYMYVYMYVYVCTTYEGVSGPALKYMNRHITLRLNTSVGSAL